MAAVKPISVHQYGTYSGCYVTVYGPLEFLCSAALFSIFTVFPKDRPLWRLFKYHNSVSSAVCR